MKRFSIIIGLLVIVASLTLWRVKEARCWGCFGGPCITSAACVEGCHCMGDPGRCG